MKTKTAFSMLFLSFYAFFAIAQSNMKTEEKKLITTYKEIRTKIKNSDKKKAVAKFENALRKVLSKKESWNYTFPQLQKLIVIESSKDGKIRAFGWDTLMGGSWHAIKNLIQFKSGDKIHVVSLKKDDPIDEDDEGNDILADAAIMNIYAFHKGYILEGYGTYGSGNHHKILAYFEMKGKKLKRTPIFEDEEALYVLMIPRKYKFDIVVDAGNQTITHSEYEMNPDVGFFQPTGKKVLLTFDGTEFTSETN